MLVYICYLINYFNYMPFFKKSSIKTIINPKRGFTLIELLVVIAVIGIVSTLAVVALNNSRASARDAKRISDLRQISSALELYYANNQQYPASLNFGEPLSDGEFVYMESLPSNPTPRTDGNCPDLDYSYYSLGNDYSITTCLGSPTQQASVSASPSFSLSSAGDFLCGQMIFDRDGYNYPTVQIGGQCWLAENLKTKTKANGVALSNLYNGSERDCIALGDVRGTEEDCSAGYTLYSWAASMDFAPSCNLNDCQASITSPHQGICPDGWHLPTDDEWHTLEMFLKDPASTCNPTRPAHWQCGPAGDKMKVGGSAGFNGIMAGKRDTLGDTFAARREGAHFWSASQKPDDPQNGAFLRLMWRSETGGWVTNTVGRTGFEKRDGLSVRCVKN